VSIVLGEGCSLIGTDPDAAIRLNEPTVSSRHAEIDVDEDRIEVRDLGSKNGTFVGARRVTARRIYPGMALSFGRAGLTLESVTEDDLELGVRFDADDSSVAVGGPGADSTVGLRPVELFVNESLVELLTLLRSGADEARLAQAGGQALFAALPAVRVRISSADDPDAVIFSAEQPQAQNTDTVKVEFGGGDHLVTVELPSAQMANPFRPLVETVAAILDLASDRGADLPLGRPDVAIHPPKLPDPPSVSASVLRIYAEATRVARGAVGVLICGQSGTGKEVLSRFIHDASGRRDAPFVALNCAALPDNLLEAELFGIERGVATGVERRPGKFELASGGTLFLDEIGDMARSTQAKILRVLQEKQVYRLGGSRAYDADCRIVAATNRDIDELLDQDRFRTDLYYRIATWVVELPALRYRREDIPNLAAHFLKEEAGQRGVRVRGITKAALEVLSAYAWPGNIRQLRNEIARAALFLDDGQALEASHLSPEIAATPGPQRSGLLEERLARFERSEILKAFQRCGNLASEAAKDLGIGRSTLYRRMKALGIEPAGDGD